MMEEITTIELIEKVLDWLIGTILIGFPSLIIADFFLTISSFKMELACYPTIPDPWKEIEGKELKELVSKAQSQTEVLKLLAAASSEVVNSQPEKLTFAKVQKDFAKKGWKFEKHRSGHFRYHVRLGVAHPKRFKNLQSSLEWLNSHKPNAFAKYSNTKGLVNV